jgi:hypothetical protein
LLTLVVLAWIGNSLARADTVQAAVPLVAGDGNAAADARVERLLAAFERWIAAVEQAGARAPTAVGGASASPTPAHPATPALDGMRAELAELRTVLAQAPSAASYGDGSLHARAAPAKLAADSLRAIRARLDSGSVSGEHAEPKRARKELMFQTPAMILARFGKPDAINVRENGTETWYYNGSRTRTLLYLEIRNGYVIGVN